MRWYKRKALWAVAGGLYLLFVMIGGCADQFILYPSCQPVSATGGQSHRLPFESGELHIVKARSPGAQAREPQAFVLAFIGNASRAEYVAAPLAMEWNEHPVEVWALNPPGYGASTGPARLNRLAPAALAAYDALAAEARGRPIYLSGESLGTTVALHLAVNRPVDGLILRAPVPLRNLILGHYGWWNLWLAAGPIAMGVPDDLDSLENARRVKAPVAFLIIDDDEIVPATYQRMVAQAHPGPQRLVEKAAANHNGALTPAAKKEYAAALEWLWDGAQTRQR